MIAHIREYDKKEQSVYDHCHNVGDLCAEYAGPLGAENIGKLQGLLHDIGKLTKKFEKYIKNETNFRRGEIDHSYAGARIILDLAEQCEDVETKKTAQLIAHTIISHHGIHDWLDNQDQDYVSDRVADHNDFDEILEHFKDVISDRDCMELLKKASQEFSFLENRLKQIAQKKKKAFAFYSGMLERVLQSCLIDADRTDTAAFMNNELLKKTENKPAPWTEMEERLEEKYREFSLLTDTISRQRFDIAGRCLKFAEHPSGVCRLIVPTGGGKTLSSLRYAVHYCKKYRKKRIFYIAPYMSILEQNSDEIRKIAGDDYFTEHHSNLYAEIDDKEELQDYELRTEKWTDPVIATTMVQFLNTLYSGKSSSIRRMHQLIDSVIIIDEVQSIPLKCVNLFNLAVNFLSKVCGTTVVLCSATQPNMQKTDYPILMDSEDSMTGETEEDFEIFRRTEIISHVTPYGMTYEEAADFSAEKYEENGNLLIVVNTKTAAREMYRLMKDRFPSAAIIHLSTNLCPQHRREKIMEMKELLKRGRLICVTTQLIEAGVDISFKCVIRSLAGLDNAAQAAGRCNRNGESKVPCPVYIIKLKEENIDRLEGLRISQQITQQILESESYADYLSFEVQKKYFEKLYQGAGKNLCYPVCVDGIKTSLISLLSTNENHFNLSGLNKTKPYLEFFVQAFKTAGSLFEVIDSQTRDLVVPYNDEARDLIMKLDDPSYYLYSSDLLRKAQKYTINVYDAQNRKLKDAGAVRMLHSGVSVLEEPFYDEDFGVTTEGSEQEVLII